MQIYFSKNRFIYCALLLCFILIFLLENGFSEILHPAKTSLEFIPCLSRRGLKMCLVPCASRRTRHAAFIKAVSSSLQRCSCSEAAGARYSNVPSGLRWGFNCLLAAVSQHGRGWKKPISCSQLRWTSVCSCVAFMFYSVFGVRCVAERQAQKRKKKRAKNRPFPLWRWSWLANICQTSTESEAGLVLVSFLAKISLNLPGFRSTVNRKQQRRLFILCLAQISPTWKEFLQTRDKR